MKIIQVIETFFPDSLGGTETYVLNVGLLMQSRGHTVYVVAPTHDISQIYEYKGLTVIRYKIKEKVTANEFKQLEPPSSLNEFVKILETINPDIVHFNTLNRIINIYNVECAKKLGARVFVTPHISSIFCPLSSLINHAGRRCDGMIDSHRCNYCFMRSKKHSMLLSRCVSILSSLVPYMPKAILSLYPPASMLKYNRRKEFKQLAEYADGIVAISDWIEKTLRNNGLQNVYLIRQGISSVFQKQSTRRYTGKDSLRLIYVGRVYPIKGLEVLCDALRQVEISKIQITFACVCGKDTYAQSIKDFIQSLPNATWLENVGQEQLQELLTANDFLILPSKSEMSPLVILEAFACGLPVIGTNIPAIADNVVSGLNGFLFEINDALSLARIITDLQASPAKVRKVKLGVQTPRTFQAVSEELLHLYNRVLTNE